MPYYEFTAGKINISCECENCGASFAYEQWLSTNISSQFLPSPNYDEMTKAQSDLNAEKQKILTLKKGLSSKKCPKCKSYQSWMGEGRQDKLAQIISGTLTALLLLIGFWFVYDRNKEVIASYATQYGVWGSIAVGTLVGLGALAMLGQFFFNLINLVMKPLVKKIYVPQTVPPVTVKEPILSWTDINKLVKIS